MRTQAKTKRAKRRENACDKVTIGFSFESDWLIEWCEFLDQAQSGVDLKLMRMDYCKGSFLFIFSFFLLCSPVICRKEFGR